MAAWITPPKSRATISEVPEGLRIVIPAKAQPFTTAFLAFWLCVWAFAEVTQLRSLAQGETPSLGWVMGTIWIVGWTAGGSWALRMWLWEVVGREVILVDYGTLTVRREILRYALEQRFELALVRYLRVQTQAMKRSGAREFWDLWGFDNPTIWFDYGAKTYSFGFRLEEAEAKEIISTIRKRFSLRDEEDRSSTYR